MISKVKKFLIRIQKKYLLRREVIVYAFVKHHPEWKTVIWSFPWQNKKFRKLIVSSDIRIRFINEIVWQFGEIYHRRVCTGNPSSDYSNRITSKGKIIPQQKWNRMFEWEKKNK